MNKLRELYKPSLRYDVRHNWKARRNGKHKPEELNASEAELNHLPLSLQTISP